MILAIETATPRGSVALVSGDALLAEELLSPGRQASETILGAVERLLRDTGSRPGGTTHVAVSAGPGSFTGLRVGMAAAKGFCFGWRVPIVPVPTLHALALRFPSERMTLCPVLDAKKKQVYAALFRWEGGECRRLSPDMAIAPAELAGKLPDGTVFFCGDAAAPFAPVFRERLGQRAVFAASGEGFPRAGAVGLLAARLVREGAACDAGRTVPVYVRPSEAELKRS